MFHWKYSICGTIFDPLDVHCTWTIVWKFGENCHLATLDQKVKGTSCSKPEELLVYMLLKHTIPLTDINLLALKNMIWAGFWAIISEILIDLLGKMPRNCAKMLCDWKRKLVSCVDHPYPLKTPISPIVAQAVKVCQMLFWRTKNRPHFISIWDTVTKL